MTIEARTDADYVRVPVGQDTPWGQATTFCTGSLDGRWACATHGVPTFADRAALATHVAGAEDQAILDRLAAMATHVEGTVEPCLMVWRCRMCGEPHGWRPV